MSRRTSESFGDFSVELFRSFLLHDRLPQPQPQLDADIDQAAKAHIDRSDGLDLGERAAARTLEGACALLSLRSPTLPPHS